ncbi:MAG: 30S ribosomal protein S5 [Candidatus Heimdallarchaeota archaeon]|nr:30S ribosomal protein S5 [Candidatus Heimdallarchaeota archaeon]
MAQISEWQPKTKLGLMVKKGEIVSIHEIFKQSLKISEEEIIDALVQNLEDEVININLVQRQTDAGEKSRFKACVAVGNRNGLVGIGEAKTKEIGPAIRKAITTAKLHLSPIRRGCGSWECSCHDPHSIPFKVRGKTGNCVVEAKPAPKGLGLASGNIAKIVFELAGITDIWTKTFGETRTTPNYAKAAFEALKGSYKVVTPKDWGK